MTTVSFTFVTAGIIRTAIYIDSIKVYSGPTPSPQTLMNIIREQGLDNKPVSYNLVTANRFMQGTCLGRGEVFDSALPVNYADLHEFLD